MLEKQVPAGMEYMDGVLEALREYLEEVNCPKKTALHLEIALEELFTNIASYAYGESPDRCGYTADWRVGSWC